MIAVAYGLMALFFLLFSEDLSSYQLLAVYDKIMIYLLTPLLLLLFCRVETVIEPTLKIRQGSRRRALAVCLALHGVCVVFCSLLWPAMTNVCALLHYRMPMLCLEDTEVLVILRYIPLWLLLAEMSILIGKFLPHKASALSCAAGYLIFAVELLSVSILLPPQLDKSLLNAQCFQKMRAEFGSFSEYIWEFTRGKHIFIWAARKATFQPGMVCLTGSVPT